ncbi:flowering-promoting factor 1-like protein 1 [Lolium perenne]|uniref:flowering-promoting factor 1-like protein 1 n=1 Tax=Lolium perenne TaxID=4522 RepID=UPI0021EA4CF0|nr:flowering-promoting factor 1-like protein 1 [Lolium perenne]
MSGVWVFKNGVVRLVEGPSESGCGQPVRKTLLHTPSGEAMCSHEALERKLLDLGWERYHDAPELVQYQKRSSVQLISLPKDFNKVKSMHMYDVVVKNRDAFQVVNAAVHVHAENKASADKAEAADADQGEA